MRGDGILIRLTTQEKEIIKELKDKHAINISQFVRNKLGELYEEVSKKQKK